MVKEKTKSKTKKDLSGASAVVKKSTEELLSLMGVNGTVEVAEDKDNQAIRVDIDSPEAGLLIGSRGETINSLQSILGMIVRQKLGDWQRILVNIADWREKEEERLKELAMSAAKRVKETGEPQALYNLTPGQRRIVHMVLADDPEVKTESMQEGRDRYLEVSLL